METAGDHTIPPTFDNARKKRMLRCFALLAAACMKCQWDICYALLRELLVILLADRFDYYYSSERHISLYYPLLWKSSSDNYCYELAKGAWLEFHYNQHWTLIILSDDWVEYILYIVVYFIMYLLFYVQKITLHFWTMVLS